jgi:hypothetical protein
LRNYLLYQRGEGWSAAIWLIDSAAEFAVEGVDQECGASWNRERIGRSP